MVWVHTSKVGGTSELGGMGVDMGVVACKKEGEGEEVLTVGGGSAKEQLS